MHWIIGRKGLGLSFPLPDNNVRGRLIFTLTIYPKQHWLEGPHKHTETDLKDIYKCEVLLIAAFWNAVKSDWDGWRKAPGKQGSVQEDSALNNWSALQGLSSHMGTMGSRVKNKRNVWRFQKPGCPFRVNFPSLFGENLTALFSAFSKYVLVTISKIKVSEEQTEIQRLTGTANATRWSPGGSAPLCNMDCFS